MSSAALVHGDDAVAPDTEVLDSVQRRVLWLAVRMVDHANHDRVASPDDVKVGGHQASSASMVGIMTALWFGHLRRQDKVAVKPHASPVYHAIKYLTGELDRSYLETLRAFGGLQAYPSRTKDPDVADFSTGSVGLGAVAPLFAAAAHRYADCHFHDQPPARFISLVGDAELDEGSVWEAVSEPALRGLGNVMLIVDVNRQSLDRVVPGTRIKRYQRFFEAAGWHVVEAKYGRRLEGVFARPEGDRLRTVIDEMSNEDYQDLIRMGGEDIRRRLVESDPALEPLLAGEADETLPSLLADLGGHDVDLLLTRYRECDAEPSRPSVVFAYTIKGWGLPFAGDRLNHSALLSRQQIDELRAANGLDVETEWDGFASGTPERSVCDAVGAELNNPARVGRPAVPVPRELGIRTPKRSSTQEAFGRFMARLASEDDVAERVVTVSPDVAVSTSLGAWINKVGVFEPDLERTGDEQSILRWEQGPLGRHIELGISEMNLFLMLGQLGLAHDHHGEHLLPIGTVYDPFVLRGLDAFIYGLYNDARFIVVGTPSGVSLAPEGGAHQSTITPSVGIELPGLVSFEPAYAQTLDWILSDALAALSKPNGHSSYLRLSTRPIDQGPFERAQKRLGATRLRSDVLSGAYVLLPAEDGSRPLVNLVGSGAVLPEVLEAYTMLGAEGVAANVIDVTSPSRLFHTWRQDLQGSAREGLTTRGLFHLTHLLPPSQRAAPVVTVHDSSSHALAWIGSALGAKAYPLGVDVFGQSGSIEDLYRYVGLTPEVIVDSALLALEEDRAG